MKYHAGSLDGKAKWDMAHALVLAHTPGVPLEWIYAAFGLGEIRRRRLRDAVKKTPTGDWPARGLENAASVVPGDGWKMLEAVCPGYSGPAPLAAQLDLQADIRSNGVIAGVLGVHVDKVRRWRRNVVFDPLTGVRLVPNRGVSMF